MPDHLLAALRVKAQANGMDLALYIRTQLAATLDRPANILKSTRETAR